MILSLQRFCDWLANTRPSTIIQDVGWIIPTVQVVHICCIGVVVASAAMVDLRLFGLAGRSDTVAGSARRLLPWIWATLPILLLTGVVMIVGEPGRELENKTFYIKMALLAVAIVVTAALQWSLSRDVGFWETSPTRRRLAKVMALLSMACWIGIVFAGRLIAYSEHG